MARMKLIPRRTLPDVITPQQWARRFRTYYRDSNATFGQFLAGFLALWQEAKNYVTDYEASQRLINQVPGSWRVWAETQMGELMFKDSITGALRCHITNLVQRLIDQRTMYGNPPNSVPAKGKLSPNKMLDHISSNSSNGCALQCLNNDMEDGPSTNFVLRRGPNSDEVVEVPRTRERARKKTHDSAASAVDARACRKRVGRVLLIHEDDEPVED